MGGKTLLRASACPLQALHGGGCEGIGRVDVPVLQAVPQTLVLQMLMFMPLGSIFWDEKSVSVPGSKSRCLCFM